MAKSKTHRPSKLQRLVIDDLFESGLAEAEVLEKHKVQRHVFRRWLNEEAFTGEMAFRIESAKRQSRLIIARFAPVAAAKLVALATDSKEETARKACLDIIGFESGRAEQNQTQPEFYPAGPEAVSELSPETASRLLAVLAKDN